MTTVYKILVYRHREQRFVESFSEYLEHETNTFSCSYNTYVNHKI